jgi:hypothetical protein
VSGCESDEENMMPIWTAGSPAVQITQPEGIWQSPLEAYKKALKASDLPSKPSEHSKMMLECHIGQI